MLFQIKKKISTNLLKEKIIIQNDYRKLTEKEREILKRNHNFSQDWSHVFVKSPFFPEKIVRCFFQGENFISEMTEGSFLYNSVFKSCRLGRNIRIENVGLIQNFIIEDHSVIQNCQQIIMDMDYRTILNKTIFPTNEIETKKIVLYPDITFDEALFQIETGLDQECYDLIDSMIYAEMLHYGVISKCSKVLNTPVIKNSFISENTQINNALQISNSIIWGDKSSKTVISSGAMIDSSWINWNCQIQEMSIVKKSLICEGSKLEKQAKIHSSVLGPNSIHGAGEITSSFCGPFTSLHHQSLLISSYWPLGKGNVGYGANIGSNHTGKLADQESHIGEGIFWGLGISIKFPFNTIAAPYSIFASGITALPQKISFPFSLINSPSKYFEDVPPAYNEIYPAWIFKENIYTLLRSMDKYKKRNRATRSRFNFDFFRADILQDVLRGLKRLEQIHNKKEVYLEKDVQGLGKNFMTESNRLQAISSYKKYIQCAVLERLFQSVEQKDPVSISNIKVKFLLDDFYYDLYREFLEESTLKELLIQYSSMLEGFKNSLIKSKSKDFIRANKILSESDNSFMKPEENEFVIKYSKTVSGIQDKIALWIK